MHLHPYINSLPKYLQLHHIVFNMCLDIAPRVHCIILLLYLNDLSFNGSYERKYMSIFGFGVKVISSLRYGNSLFPH